MDLELQSFNIVGVLSDKMFTWLIERPHRHN